MVQSWEEANPCLDVGVGLIFGAAMADRCGWSPAGGATSCLMGMLCYGIAYAIKACLNVYLMALSQLLNNV